MRRTLSTIYMGAALLLGLSTVATNATPAQLGGLDATAPSAADVLTPVRWRGGGHYYGHHHYRYHYRPRYSFYYGAPAYYGYTSYRPSRCWWSYRRDRWICPSYYW
jgi:hypothetical protein